MTKIIKMCENKHALRGRGPHTKIDIVTANGKAYCESNYKAKPKRHTSNLVGTWQRKND